MTRTDDTGTLTMAMLLMMIGTMLSVVMVPVALNHVTATRDQTRRTQSLGAAEAGLDVALGQVRAASSSGAGVTGWLPCGPITGEVTPGGDASYRVTIDYFTTDPKGRSDAWLASSRLACTANAGTMTTPGYALFRAEGIASPVGAFGTVPSRKLDATYMFHLDNRLVAGGLIHINRGTSGKDLCMDAGSDTPAAGTNVRMMLCDPTSSRQRFFYSDKLTLSLVASKTPANRLGMCLDADTDHANNYLIYFAACTKPNVDPRQQWSINASANFEGTKDGKTLDKFCFNMQSPDVVGSFLILRTGSGCGQAYNNVQTFYPEASVGAGAAGKDAGQLVNFDQFGRCLDVTNQKTDSTFLIAWPCKQAPDPANVDWNQKWALPAAGVEGPIITTKGTDYCLTSPGSTAPTKYVTVTICPKKPEDLENSMKWQVFEDTGEYEGSYVVMDHDKHCLSVTDPDASPPDLFTSGNKISKIVVATCDGSKEQKWNARADLLDSVPLKDVLEK